MVNNTEDYDYLKHAVRDNRFSLEASIGSEMNQLFPRVIVGNNNEYFYSALKWTGAVIGIIIIVGVLYELYKRKNKPIINKLYETSGKCEKVPLKGANGKCEKAPPNRTDESRDKVAVNDTKCEKTAHNGTNVRFEKIAPNGTNGTSKDTMKTLYEKRGKENGRILPV